MAEGAGSGGLPAAPPQTPGFPQNPIPLTFDGFTTLNTKPARTGIGDQEMFWCDNFMPLGKNNLRTLYDVGDPKYTAAGGRTIEYFAFANIGDTKYCMIFLDDGSIVAVDTDTGTPTTVNGAGTITTPTNSIGVSQWGDQFILIVAPQTDGYFLWDGTLFYRTGDISPTVDIASGGFGYSSVPSVTAVGGAGSGTGFSVTVANGAVSAISVTNQGGFYIASDFVYLAFSGGGASVATAIASSAILHGSVSAVSIVNAGLGYTTTSAVQFLGGGGFGARGSVVASGGTVASVSILASGFGYSSAPTVYITDGNNPVAEATALVMPFGVQGTQLETYQNHVWITNGSAPSNSPPRSRVLFTATGSPVDVNPGDGAGAFISTDSFLRVGYHGIKQSNGFLYLVGDSSLNYISGVQTSGNPAVTTFQNQNVDPQIGSPWPNTVQVFSRNVVFANTFGVHVSYGGAVTKVSDPLDGFYTSVKPTGSQPSYGGLIPSAAVAEIFGIHCYLLLLPVLDYDPQTNKFDGAQVNKLLMWDGKRWWTAQPSVTLTQIASQEINSVLTAYGTDGHKIYPLFQTPSDAITKTVVSKLWDNPGYYITKMAQELFGITAYYSDVADTIDVSIDNGQSSTLISAIGSQQQLLWFNSLGAQIPWTGAGSNPLLWFTGGGGIVFGPYRVTQVGQIIGLTTTTQAADMALVSETLIEQSWQTNI